MAGFVVLFQSPLCVACSLTPRAMSRENCIGLSTCPSKNDQALGHPMCPVVQSHRLSCIPAWRDTLIPKIPKKSTAKLIEMYSYDPEPTLSPLRRLWRHRTRRSSLLLIGCVLSDSATVDCCALYLYLLLSGHVACVFFQMAKMRQGERHAKLCSKKRYRIHFQFKIDASSAISSCLLFKYAGT